MSKSSENEISIILSTSSIVKVVSFLLLFYLLYLIKGVVFILFLAFILAMALEPAVDWLEKRKIVRPVGMIIVYLLLLAFFIIFIYLIFNPVVNQLSMFAKNFPLIWQKFIYLISQIQFYLTNTGLASETKNLLDSLQLTLTDQLWKLIIFLKDVFQAIFYFFIILVLIFFIIIEKFFWQKVINDLTPRRYHNYLLQLISDVKKKIGEWLRGQLTLCFVVFLLAYGGLSFLGVKYALLLALFSGFAEFVPLIGPLIGEIPAVFLAFFQSPILALKVVIFYFLIQQLDANFLAPKIMGKAVGLNPVIIILAILAGAALGGVLGVICAVPAAAILSIITKDFLKFQER